MSFLSKATRQQIEERVNSRASCESVPSYDLEKLPDEKIVVVTTQNGNIYLVEKDWPKAEPSKSVYFHLYRLYSHGAPSGYRGLKQMIPMLQVGRPLVYVINNAPNDFKNPSSFKTTKISAIYLD